MPMNKTGKKMMKSMKDTYGDKKGKKVFYAMENQGKVPGMAKGGSMKPMGYAKGGLTKFTGKMNTGLKKCGE